MLKRGVDVSVHNGNINWKAVAGEKIDFSIIRAGYGKSESQKDERFENNYYGCKEQNIECGAYWYSYASSASEAAEEAKVCLKVIKDKKFEYPIFFDIENNFQAKLSINTCSEIVKTFCNIMEDEGYFVGVYSYKSFLESYISEEVRNRYTVWVSHTDVDQTSYKSPYGIWQFSHTGRVNGIDTAVDLNSGYVDYSSIIAPKGYNGFNTQNSTVFKKGDIVRIKKGAKSYSHESLASFVYNRDHIISEIRNNRAVITFNDIVVAAVHTDNLIKTG